MQVFLAEGGVHVLLQPLRVVHGDRVALPFAVQAALGLADARIVAFEREAEFTGVYGALRVGSPDEDVRVFPQHGVLVEVDILRKARGGEGKEC